MTGIIGLTVSFLLLASVLCYILIRSNTNAFLKAALVIMTIWYAVVLYFVPQSLQGWPKLVSDLPDNSLIITYRIVEPSGMAEKGGMYFWLLENTDKIPYRANPIEAFKEIDNKKPRAYGIPYDRELHKQLEAAKKKAKRRSGLMVWKKGMGGKNKLGEGRKKTKRGRFEVINPTDLLPKKEDK